MRRVLHRPLRCVYVAALAVCAGWLAGCGTARPTEPAAIVRTEPPPAYSAVAVQYNERVSRLNQVWARSIVRLTYRDEKGKEHEEQGEGILQVARPDRMALSIKKAGRMLFWFGGDKDRYWLFDIVDEPVVRVGRQDLVGRHADNAGLGLDIKPNEMIRLLGITPLPSPSERGAPTTAWSRDGRYVEVRVPISGGSAERVSLDPESLVPIHIVLLDPAGAEVVTADLERYGPVTIANYGGARPQIAGRVIAQHAQSKTLIKLDLAEPQNFGINEKAFQFDELCRMLGVERVIDLDVPPPQRAGAR